MEAAFLPIYLFLLFAMLFGTFTVVLPSAFASCLTSSLFSISCAILYFFLQSPDVSMTEASIGVFLSTAFFLMTIRIIKLEFFEPPHLLKVLLAFIFFILLSFIVYSEMIELGRFGAILGTASGSGTLHLIGSYKDFHIPNVITTILAYYRGFDTMGETIIILTSSFGVFMILNTKNSKFNTL